VQTYIKDVMSSEVTSVSCESTVKQSESTMLTTNRRCVPIVDGSGVCVGVLSHSDILRVRNQEIDVSSISVKEIMSGGVVSVSPHCSIDDATDLMIDHGIHHVLVIQSKQVIGIVSLIDIIKVDKAQRFNRFDDSLSYVPIN